MSIHTTVPPATDPPLILQRTDEVHTILRIFSEPTTSVVMLTGDAGAGVFIVLDQFDELLDAGTLGRVAVSLFLEMLQQDLGASRFLLTSYRSPYGSTNGQQARIRSYLVSRVSIPEGVALLQQH